MDKVRIDYVQSLVNYRQLQPILDLIPALAFGNLEIHTKRTIFLDEYNDLLNDKVYYTVYQFLMGDANDWINLLFTPQDYDNSISPRVQRLSSIQYIRRFSNKYKIVSYFIALLFGMNRCIPVAIMADEIDNSSYLTPIMHNMFLGTSTTNRFIYSRETQNSVQESISQNQELVSRLIETRTLILNNVTSEHTEEGDILLFQDINRILPDLVIIVVVLNPELCIGVQLMIRERRPRTITVAPEMYKSIKLYEIPKDLNLELRVGKINYRCLGKFQ